MGATNFEDLFETFDVHARVVEHVLKQSLVKWIGTNLALEKLPVGIKGTISVSASSTSVKR